MVCARVFSHRQNARLSQLQKQVEDVELLAQRELDALGKRISVLEDAGVSFSEDVCNAWYGTGAACPPTPSTLPSTACGCLPSAERPLLRDVV